jgi:radical SAM protein with 4Fe4S-binding SPASM domain
VVSKANFKKIKESMQFLKSKGIHSFKLISLSQLGRSAKNKKYQITSKQYFTAIKDAIDFCLKSDSKLQLYPVYYLIYNLLNKDRPYMCLRSPCGAVNSVLAFDTKGNIYPCDDLVGFKQYILGNVFDTSLEKVLKNRTSKMFQERTVDKIDDCMECTWRNFCGGGCSGRVLLTYGKLNHCSDICDYYRTIFPYLIELIYKDKEKVAEKMMSCALE